MSQHSYYRQRYFSQLPVGAVVEIKGGQKFEKIGKGKFCALPGLKVLGYASISKYPCRRIK